MPPPASVLIAYSASFHPWMSGDLPCRSIGLVEARFFIADKSENEGPIRLHAVLLQPEDGRHKRDDACLIVERSAAIEIAVFFDQFVRVALPVLGPRVDHVHVGRKQDRLRRGVGARDAHQHGGGLTLRQLGDVAGCNAAITQDAFKVIGHSRHLALALRRPELDDFRENLPSLHLVRTLLRERRRIHRHDGDADRKSKTCHASSPNLWAE